MLEGGLARAGVPYSYGFAIILLTVLVKAATYPLTKKSVSVVSCKYPGCPDGGGTVLSARWPHAFCTSRGRAER